MKKVLSKIITASILTIGLAITSGVLINKKDNILVNESSYTLTSFDITIEAPSNEQFNTFKNNKDAFNDIFPVYNYKIDVNNGSKTSKCNVLLSNQMSSFECSLLNKNTLIEGSYDENKLMIDKNIADLIGAKLGSEISFTIMNKKFTNVVSAIYMKSTYNNFDKGVIIGKWTSEMESTVPNNKYSLAFADVNNNASALSALEGYLPLGALIEKEVYIADYKSSHPKGASETEQEYQARCEQAYNEYYQRFVDLYKDSTSTVIKKSVLASDAIGQNKSSKNMITRISIIIPVVGSVLLGAVLTATMFINRAEDLADNDNDRKKKTMLRSNLAQLIIVSLVSSIICFIVTIICSNAALFAIPNFILQILMFGFAPLASLIISCPMARVYANYIYKRR